jgi:CubicO group peptidase (beta-lactamase class C family)
VSGFAQVDELFATRFAEGTAPGLVYGVVRHGELIHTGGLGRAVLADERRPDEHTVMRIASMSKSFTAVAALLLRDRGLLDLDVPVPQYVPELVDQPSYSSHSPAVTLRLLLTMAAGIPTDNPWGDRQESLGRDDFGTFLDGGFTVGAEPGTGFEYANLGYGLLGRAVDGILGESFRDLVERELLAPLGMTATRYDVTEVGPALAPGYAKRGEEWVELEPMSPGAFSAMGGLHSTITDLARWVGGFTAAYDGRGDAHPLAKASRREMQQMQRFRRVLGRASAVPDRPGVSAVAQGYGFGLFVDHDSELGQLVHHSGGYPGYGSQMVWHPETGLGVVTMSNGSYGGAYQQAFDALAALLRAEARPAARPSVPGTLPAVAAATAHLAAFDPEDDARFTDPALFAENVVLDVPEDQRRRELRAVREKVGVLLPGGEPEVWSAFMAHAEWVVPAERGLCLLELTLSPEATPRIQELHVKALPPAPAEVLGRAREALAADNPETRLLRAFGTPELVETPITTGERSTDLLLAAGTTWWRITVPAEGAATVTPYDTAAWPRLEWLARQLLSDPASGVPG